MTRPAGRFSLAGPSEIPAERFGTPGEVPQMLFAEITGIEDGKIEDRF